MEHLAAELDGGWGIRVVLREAQDSWEDASFVWCTLRTPIIIRNANFHKQRAENEEVENQ